MPNFPTLINDDCLIAMAKLPPGSVDAIICDPPFGTTQNRWDAVIPFDAMWAAYWRVLKPNGVAVLMAQCPFDKMLGASCPQHLKYEWIWSKTRATGHLNTWKQPLKNHENALVFYREQCTYNPQGILRKIVPTIRRGGDNGTNYGKSDKDALQEWENFPRSVLPIPSEGATVHPTQKPVALMDYLIRTYTNPGDVVLDNTMGSGTTLVAAVNAGRRGIGIERDPGYFQIARERVTGAYFDALVLAARVARGSRAAQLVRAMRGAA